MPSVSQHTATHPLTRSASDRLGRVVLFLATPFFILAYYTAVTVLRVFDRDHE